jgi:plasmid stability protein
MKQLLLRVPDDVHRRLAARAARDGRSVNALATQILDAAVDADEGDRRARLRATAAATGLLRSVPAKSITPARRRRIIASTKGTGPILDQLLAEERDRV